MSGLSGGNWSSISNSNHHQSIDHLPDNHQSDHPTGINEYDRLCQVDPATRQMVDGYSQMVITRVNEGWSCHLMTFLFRQLPGPRDLVIQAMMDELQRVYSILVTRAHRKPRTAPADELPFLIGTADLPVYKRDKSSSPLVLCTGGLHFHALLLVPPNSRLNRPVEEHIQDHLDMYLGRRPSITKLEIEPVTYGHESVVDYVFKTILRKRVSYDEGVLVLPRTRDELSPVRSAGEDRPFTQQNRPAGCLITRSGQRVTSDARGNAERDSYSMSASL